MMKKIFAAILVCVMLAASCAFAEAHEHNFRQSADGTNHWKRCIECAEVTDEGMHELDEYGDCIICGSSILEYGDGVSVFIYDEYGNTIEMCDIDADGQKFFCMEYFFTYDENGNILNVEEYTDGFLSADYNFIVVNGESVECHSEIYYADASYCVFEYDEFGNPIRVTSYYPDGTVEYEDVYEYAQDAEGFWIQSGYITTYSDGSYEVAEYDEFGNPVIVTYYDVSGVMFYECVYENAENAEGYRYQKKTVITFADGAYEITENDEFGNCTRYIVYDGEGNVVNDQVWEYTYSEDGYITSEKFFFYGMLQSETVYSEDVGEDYIFVYPETYTEYYEDGSYTVTVSDSDYNVISETTYDAEGNIIE